MKILRFRRFHIRIDAREWAIGFAASRWTLGGEGWHFTLILPCVRIAYTLILRSDAYPNWPRKS